ncbi:hypothetical protein [Streptomyces griseofuscus]|uniref:Uncharacterized protein n=1 Tax=Streptomyces griseofuscus TaxID=146922 RepID=A0A7H1Q3M1_9ACTN|nr:hypothetical protein [Streptomyces griseofuscus]QNT94901.1 hypothetical protein HEP81_04628 [Streptomyces griseofuscus]
MDTTTTDMVFTLAIGATSWKRTNLGLTTTVSHAGYTWTVRLPKGHGKAYIDGREGYGGSEFAQAEASWAQTGLIVDAAMAATRVH